MSKRSEIRYACTSEHWALAIPKSKKLDWGLSLSFKRVKFYAALGVSSGLILLVYRTPWPGQRVGGWCVGQSRHICQLW